MTLREALLRGRRRPRAFGTGSPTTYRGDGYEFVELRAYVPGDDVRRIDWAATARAGDLQTRVVLEDVALILGAILDDSGSMQVGRKRTLHDAATQALHVWFAAANAEDRCVRIGADVVAPRRSERGLRAARIAATPLETPFDLARALATARAALPRGSALLLISDCFDDARVDDATLAQLGRHLDCTLLFARDPWFSGLPLRGFVNLRDARGANLRAFIGARERARYVCAVRDRETRVVQRFTQANWRVGILIEDDGRASLERAFGLPQHGRTVV